MNKALFAICLTAPYLSFAQSKKDSIVNLQPIDLKVYFAKQSLLSTTTSIHSLSEATIQQQSPNTLLTALNTVSGIRMEERSPGSYRVAMRGSLIRSPFGIRNTKVYIDEFPLTDAGGNTYLNLLDPNGIRDITVVKGPDGSLYGANSGGIIKISPKGFGELTNHIDLNINAGSYGLFSEQISIAKEVSPKYQFGFNQAFTRSDGYRDNTALNKKVFQTSHQWNYNPSSQLRIFALYTDLAYQTPGGLTQQQYDDNPKQARPAVGKTPGAVEQKAAIYNKTLFGGIAHSKALHHNLTHHISIFGSLTDFKNPFITNYEVRKESNIGVRTYLSWQKNQVQMQLGAEGIYGVNKVENFDNDKGTSTALQAKDDLDNQTWNLFYRTQVQIIENWNIEGSIGLNTNMIKFEKHYPSVENGSIKFNNQWMPRLATSYQIQNMAWRFSYAKGYSTPTLAEVRSSSNDINTSLQAEHGNNFEIGYKIKTNNQRILFDIAAYNYNMNNGIMRQVNEASQEYFSNVGQMKQKGVESSLWIHLIKDSPVIKSLIYQGSLSYNHYRFGNYQSNTIDLEGKKITAVPDWVWSNTLQINILSKLGLNVFHNYTSAIPLNDANTVFAKKYNLVQAKFTWDVMINRKTFLQLYAGVDNLLDEKYSLGNDINAFGGRFFNPAPTRNYYVGIKASLK